MGHANSHVNRPAAPADRGFWTRYPGLQGGSPMQSVADILKSKPDDTVHTIGPAEMVFEAVRLMKEKRIGALVVTEGGAIVGIVTERDYAQKMALRGRASRSTPVRDIMTAPVISVRPDQTSEDCMVLMGTHHMRHLPVLDSGNLVGMVSIRDLVNDIIAGL
jgi:CBS domain-containing protein